MYYYRITDVTLQSAYRLDCFGNFACEPANADMTLEGTEEFPPEGNEICSGAIVHRKITNGWYFYPRIDKKTGLFISRDYSHLRIRGIKNDDTVTGTAEWFVRIAVECMLI